MKNVALASLILASLSFNALAVPADHNQPLLGENLERRQELPLPALAADGAERTGPRRVAEDGAERSRAFRVAEGGAERVNRLRVAEGGAERLQARQSA